MKSLAVQAKVHEKNLIDELKTELLEVKTLLPCVSLFSHKNYQDDVIGSFLEASRVNPESSQPQPFISAPLDYNAGTGITTATSRSNAVHSPDQQRSRRNWAQLFKFLQVFRRRKSREVMSQ